MIGGDVFVAGSGSSVIQHRRGTPGTWAKESLPDDVAITKLFGPWALGWSKGRRQVLLQRTDAGAWTIKPSPSTETVHEIWLSPNGDAFFAAGTTVLRYAHGKWTELESPIPIVTLWGRSSTEVYGGGPSGLAQFDGKSWTETSYSGKVASIAGTKTELFVVAGAD